MKTLELNQMEIIEAGLQCDTQLGLGFGLLIGGLLLGAVTFGVGTAIAVVGYGVGTDAMHGNCDN